MDLEGHLLMDAKISELTTGAKSFFLKIVDPFFRDKGRTSIPIQMSGTVKEPKFGLAVGGAKRVKGPQEGKPHKPGATGSSLGRRRIRPARTCPAKDSCGLARGRAVPRPYRRPYRKFPSGRRIRALRCVRSIPPRVGS